MPGDGALGGRRRGTVPATVGSIGIVTVDGRVKNGSAVAQVVDGNRPIPR